MTLILSCATQEYVVQVSDRRLTNLHTGKLFDDDANKMVVFCGRMAFGYTGLGFLGGESTHVWLTKTLAKPPCKSVSEATERIRTRATDIFQQLGYNGKYFLGFVGVGWIKTSQEEPFRPLICSISNFQDNDGKPFVKPRDEFIFRGIFLQESDPFHFFSLGQTLPQQLEIDICRNIRRYVRHGVSPARMIELLTDGIRKVAAINTSVGETLLAACLPKRAIRPDRVMMLSGPPEEDIQTFLYIPAGSTDGVIHGPDFACGGGGMTGFRITPIDQGKQ